MLVGIDEVGRGALAGPVLAAAVVLLAPVKGLNDSKKISLISREKLFSELQHSSLYAIGEARVEEIEEFNILKATMLAMRRAFEKLNLPQAIALVDGNSDPQLPCETKLIIKGDASVPVISAASIIAKVTRDKIMTVLHDKFPIYRWQQNKGYGTKAHINCIQIYGKTIYHRYSFIQKIK